MQSKRPPGPQHTLPSPMDVVTATHRRHTAINPCQSLVLSVLHRTGEEGLGLQIKGVQGTMGNWFVDYFPSKKTEMEMELIVLFLRAFPSVVQQPSKFNKRKCKVLHLRRNKPMQQDRLGPTTWKTALQKRIQDVSRAQAECQSAEFPATAKADGILGCIWKSAAIRLENKTDMDKPV
ncbi:hypothetical protein QYF61_000745 [Mycteria americana]|uniref:Uncharacterized protein n=1 Tax=Mycteria americana TaxID=33587 RepID=A0AAN7S1H9_MYCAM|nr:hypothetical protein QYF61_000745 [Mycteria americana]